VLDVFSWYAIAARLLDERPDLVDVRRNIVFAIRQLQQAKRTLRDCSGAPLPLAGGLTPKREAAWAQ
jgi:hypothetical protein